MLETQKSTPGGFFLENTYGKETQVLYINAI